MQILHITRIAITLTIANTCLRSQALVMENEAIRGLVAEHVSNKNCLQTTLSDALEVKSALEDQDAQDLIKACFSRHQDIVMLGVSMLHA